MFIVATSDEAGVAFVETSNLDGERNLKTKYAIEYINANIRRMPLKNIKGNIFCDKPNNNIHKFKGLLYKNNDSVPNILTNNNVILRVIIYKF